MTEIRDVRIGPNWTSAAGALEGILTHLGAALPRHAIMGLSGHAWHFCLGTRDGVTALPSGPVDLDRVAIAERYRWTGFRWERFGRRVGVDGELVALREEAVAWAIGQLDAGRPLIGWDFHLHEHAVVFGYDRERGGFLVDDVLSGESGHFAAWADWPSALGQFELLAPVEAVAVDPVEAVMGALETALVCFAGGDGAEDGQPRGTAGLDAWAEALDGESEIDRAGNAYTLAVLQAARLDGAAFLADLAESLPELAEPLKRAGRAISDETQALSPLLTLFPFPAGGHGNVANAGLRRAAAMALRRAAGHERAAGTAIAEALRTMGDEG